MQSLNANLQQSEVGATPLALQARRVCSRLSSCLHCLQVCEDLKIQSQNDEKKLEEAKGLVYLKAFTDGVMIIGDYAGQKVAAAKPVIRQEMLASGDALAYAEPESRVMSRSGDECVVALTDQWCGCRRAPAVPLARAPALLICCNAWPQSCQLGAVPSSASSLIGL